jgi:hypothetical protein
MRAAVFVGPTLAGDPVLAANKFEWRPPAAEGDIYRAARSGIGAIGLIDGRFETSLSVWHKEILWTLSRGIHVFGAASMGALRAAELQDFGMTGVGAIYRDFRSGTLRDDDEVAVLHASQELGFQPLTDAMVDIRATLRRAEQEHIVSQRTASVLLTIAKENFFKDRTWRLILEQAKGCVPGEQCNQLARWLPRNRVGQKRLDALALLGSMRRRLSARPAPHHARFDFQSTVFWRALVERESRSRSSSRSQNGV